MPRAPSWERFRKSHPEDDLPWAGNQSSTRPDQGCADGAASAGRNPRLVRAAEDEPFAIGGRLAAADAGACLRLAVVWDDARRRGCGGLDFILAVCPAAMERAGPAGGYRRGELLPGAGCDGPLVAELGGPPQQQVLEGGQLNVQPGRGLLQR